MNQPYVIDIKCNSLDDGPGIRTTIFFKGCPLSCIWCHNPESKRIHNEISFDKNVCIGCKTCVRACKNGALSFENKYFIDRNKCGQCFTCVSVCPAKAITKVGKIINQDELVKKCLSDKPFYKVSHGGITLSGGEATLYTKWVGELAQKLKENEIDVLLETCGMFNYDEADKYLLPYLKNIYCDIKIFDKENHKKYCGVDNTIILENFKKMFNDKDKYGYDILPRVPLVPGITDTKENLEAISDYLKELGVKNASLLPYNPTWYHKAEKLGMEVDQELNGLNSFQDNDFVESCKNIFRNKGINC